MPSNNLIAAVHCLPAVNHTLMTALIQGDFFARDIKTWKREELIRAGLPGKRAEEVFYQLPQINVEQAARAMMVNNVQLITINSPAYPPQLTNIPSPPPVLYVRGNVKALSYPSLAVVGTRRPTPYGLQVTRQLLEPVVQRGLTIVSGLALGIDGAAHRVALTAKKPTVAVLGSGVDNIYPWEHRQLATDIIANQGAIISEFPLGAEPERFHFPQRNRIISGLAKAVLLVEAGEKSGALITAKFAVDQNREVLVVPGNITSPQSIGPLNWLKLGATPITCTTDIFHALTIDNSPTAAAPVLYQPQSSAEAIIIQLLSQNNLHIDELIEKSRLDNSVVSATLSLLEINGAINHLGGHIYSLV
jgi:DNA processing protein